MNLVNQSSETSTYLSSSASIQDESSSWFYIRNRHFPNIPGLSFNECKILKA